MSRDQMIELLIEHELEVNFSDSSYVREMLYSGWKGYDDMTDQEIKDQYEQIA